MSGSLIKIAETTVSSAVASVTLTGIDSTYDVYMVRVHNVTPETDGKSIQVQVTKGGTADTTSNYDRAFKELRAYAVFGDISSTNSADVGITDIGTAGNESFNGIFYLFNFPNSSEYSFCTFETTQRDSSNGNHNGAQGGFVHTVASASDGIHFKMSTATNIAGGTFVLYGLKK